jgi:hypothetical protein
MQARIKIGRPNTFLRRRGAIVPTCGEWQGATTSGALTTGSHSGSSRYSIHPTSVLSFRLVTADGLLVDVDRGRPPRRQHVPGNHRAGVRRSAQSLPMPRAPGSWPLPADAYSFPESRRYTSTEG